jgi:hypothetical protein
MKGEPLEMLATATFSAAQWRKIETALAAVDVDLDATTVDELSGPREWWGWKEGFEPGKDYTPRQVPLRDALQKWAFFAATAQGTKLPTPQERAEQYRKEVATLAQARAILDHKDVGPGLPSDDVLYARIKRRRALQTAMTEEIVERREYITKLEAEGSKSKENARTDANAYWDTLGKLWLKVTKGNVSKHRQKYLHNFLDACSQPLLPWLIEKAEQKLSKEALKRELERRLSNFVSNFLRKPKADESPESADV